MHIHRKILSIYMRQIEAKVLQLVSQTMRLAKYSSNFITHNNVTVIFFSHPYYSVHNYVMLIPLKLIASFTNMHRTHKNIFASLCTVWTRSLHHNFNRLNYILRN